MEKPDIPMNVQFPTLEPKRNGRLLHGPPNIEDNILVGIIETIVDEMYGTTFASSLVPSSGNRLARFPGLTEFKTCCSSEVGSWLIKLFNCAEFRNGAIWESWETLSSGIKVFNWKFERYGAICDICNELRDGSMAVIWDVLNCGISAESCEGLSVVTKLLSC